MEELEKAKSKGVEQESEMLYEDLERAHQELDEILIQLNALPFEDRDKDTPLRMKLDDARKKLNAAIESWLSSVKN